MKNPFRFWMTGGVAMLVAAVSGGRTYAGEDKLMLTRVSRYSVGETVQRIEACAQRHGMHVMARLPQREAHRGAGNGNGRLVIVLESSQGGTPVQMATPDGHPDLLLSVVVQLGDEGNTEVLLPEGSLHDLPDGMSAQLQNDLADLPGMVDEALNA
jgi:hypothetical protein